MIKYFLSCLLFVISSCGAAHEKPAVTVVIFGSTGDLTTKKLFPAIYNLAAEDQFDDDFALIGIGRRPISQEDFQHSVQSSLEQFSRSKPSEEQWNRFHPHLHYHEMNFDADEGYDRLATLLNPDNNTIFYLATDSSYFSTIINKLYEHGLIQHSSRVIIEKPFGHDLNSAIALQKEISQHLEESQIYRIDHYLGKEGVHKLLKLRFEDGALEQLFYRDYVSNVQFNLSETIGIGTRANFYESAGNLRDIVQNHAMQVLALATMDKPLQMDADSIHQEKINVLKSLRPFNDIDQDIIRGQYGEGTIQGHVVPGYRQEKGIPPSSSVETFVQAKLFIDNDRWKDVPFYVRSGKRLPLQTTQITFNLKENPLAINAITIVIQPNAQIILTKSDQQEIYPLELDSNYARREAYENLILAAVHGNQSDFVHLEEVYSTWTLFTPVLEHWQLSPSPTPFYPAGHWPQEAENQILQDGIQEWKIIMDGQK